MAGIKTLTSSHFIDRAGSLLGPQIRSTLPTRELFERTNASSRRPKEVAIFTEGRDSLIKSVTGPMRPGIYLEVGFGSKPYYQATSREFSSKSPYMGVDGRGSDGYRFFGEQIANTAERNVYHLRERGLPRHVDLLVGDGRSVWLPSGSVQEIFMGDVLFSRYMTSEAMFDLITEARRLLDPDTGVLVIREGGMSGTNLNSTERPSMARSAFADLGFALDLAGFDRIILDETDGAPCEAVARQFGETAQGKQFIIAKPQEMQSPVLEMSALRRTRT